MQPGNAGERSRTVITMIMIIGVAVNKLEVFGPFSIAAVGQLWRCVHRFMPEHGSWPVACQWWAQIVRLKKRCFISYPNLPHNTCHIRNELSRSYASYKMSLHSRIGSRRWGLNARFSAIWFQICFPDSKLNFESDLKWLEPGSSNAFLGTDSVTEFRCANLRFVL